ncbi:MAG: 3-oxoacyl-ACP synthase [Ignisphaera sp.]|jgi:3-oxoacyl-[acyl-carrier-protein] synthase-3|nr:3-oxoacyl-ACP synthase [Ignisphaera sp.]MCC6056716.1 3-oxoacyl-ACP synthase [Desulfurococcaceae archaeon]
MVGIVSYGLYLPSNIVTSRQVSEISGIPVEVIEEKQGWRVKRVSDPDEMPSEMAVKAAYNALEAARAVGIGPKDIDAVIYVGSEFKDYGVWLMSTRVQEALGITEAFAFDIAAMCAGYPFGLAIAKRFKDLARNILLVAASKESYLVNYKDPSTSWLNDFADGASAIIVSRDYNRNLVLESSFIADGRFWGAVVVSSLGAYIFKNGKDPELIKRPFFESVMDKELLKKELTSVSKRNFVRVIKEAVERSGYSIKDVDLLVINHMKRSFHYEIVKELGLDPSKTIYLEDYGHTQSSDMVIGLDIGIKRGIVKNGSIIVFASGGTGFIWGATVVRWG